MSILVFSDVHLGIKTHSIYESDGLTTAEHEAIKALEAVYERATQPDIDMLICCGDIFHTTHPTSINVLYLISWLNKIESLNKPFYFITGNHDSGIYSNSLIYTRELQLKNSALLDTLFPDENSVWCIQWENWDIYFIPFVANISSKDTEGPVYNAIQKVVNYIKRPSMIVTHVYDSEVVIGSEANMISRFVETLDFGELDRSDIILLLGHAHRQQMYKKRNGINVVYPGSLFYHDLNDCNQEKGYAIVSPDGTVSFESIDNIRKFVYYKISQEQDAVELIRNMRIRDNSHVFLLVESDSRIDESNLREVLKNKNCTLGDVRYKSPNLENALSGIVVDRDNLQPVQLFKEHLKMLLEQKQESDKFDRVVRTGISYLEKNSA